MLFIYAAAFSYAYVSLETGTGALILFGTVQLSLMTIGFIKKQNSHVSEFFGVPIALIGLTYLVLPELSKPSFSGAILMILAGVAWALYSAAGTKTKDPIADTAFNFAKTIPFIATCLLLTTMSSFDTTTIILTPYGIALAVLSGTLTSGLGYTLWYIAIRGLSSIQAGICQLLVPLIAAIGGVVFAGEALTERMLVASLLLIGGVAVSLFGQQIITSTHQRR